MDGVSALALAALADRIEREGPHARLDRAIARAIGWRMSRFNYSRGIPPGPYLRKQWPIPRFTTSIDAAVTLIPDGKWYMLGKGKVRDGEPLYGSIIYEAEYHDQTEIGRGETDHNDACALVSACLRARAALLKEATDG